MSGGCDYIPEERDYVKEYWAAKRRIAELERMHKVDDGIIRLQAKQIAERETLIESLEDKLSNVSKALCISQDKGAEKDALLAEAVEFIKSGIDEDIEGWHAWERRAREFVAKVRGEK